MFVGHYGPSFAGKALDNRIPLWLLFLAVQFVDVLWGIFVLLGIEKVRIVPGITASSPLDLYYMPYTHSLVGALGWSLFAYSVCKMGFGLWNYRVLAFILEMAVLFGGAAMYAKTVARKGKVIVYVVLLAVLQFVGTFALPP